MGLRLCRHDRLPSRLAVCAPDNVGAVNSDTTGKAHTVDEARDFELLTKHVMEVLLGLAPDAPLGHNVRVQGKAEHHQIDVLWEAPTAFGGPFTVLFECKKHARRVEKKDLMAFRTLVDDVAAVRGETVGVFVVSSGYQSGAVNIASTYGIVILELREPTPNDLRGRALVTSLELRIQVPVITGWDIVASGENAAENRAERVSTDHPVVLPDGSVSTLGRIVTEGVLEGFDAIPPRKVTREFSVPAVFEGTSVRIHS